MSGVWSLSGGKQTWGGLTISVAIDPYRKSPLKFLRRAFRDRVTKVLAPRSRRVQNFFRNKNVRLSDHVSDDGSRLPSLHGRARTLIVLMRGFASEDWMPTLLAGADSKRCKPAFHRRSCAAGMGGTRLGARPD